MRYPLFLLFSCLLFIACNDNEPPLSETTYHEWSIASQSQWLKDSFLQKPESIIFDSLQQVFFVSNGDQYDTRQAGFLSKIARDGQLMDLKWVEGLHRPTGMAIKNHSLFVADVNRLVEIDMRTANIINIYPSPIKHPGFNDVAINKSGEVFLSASFIHAVFRLQENHLQLWKQDTILLKWLNGLACTDTSLLAAGLQLASIPFEDQAISSIPIDTTVKDFDGIAPDGEGGYFLSTVENSSLWHLSPDLSTKKLSEGNAYFGDLSYLTKQKELLIPRGIHQQQNYFISNIKMAKE